MHMERTNVLIDSNTITIMTRTLVNRADAVERHAVVKPDFVNLGSVVHGGATLTKNSCIISFYFSTTHY